MAVFVLDKNKKPLMPCSEKRARLLLERKRAVIHLMEPFTIRLKDRKLKDSKLQEQRLKLDPGSKTTGFAVTREESDTVLLGDLEHKKGIKEALDSRHSLRRGRRNRNTRYRKPRFDNRKNSIGKCKHCGNNTPKKETKGKTKGRKSLCTPCAKKGLSSKKTIKLTRETKLSPSLAARADQTFNLAKKLQKITPIDAISMELVKFDLQKMEKPEIQGVEYQQGELQGYEVREYLLEKYGRKCAYCHKEDIPIEVEHYYPKSCGGTDSVSNLTLACRPCNEKKGNLLPEKWIEELSKSRKELDKTRLENFTEVGKQLNKPLKDATAVNATRWYLFNQLKSIGLPLETGSGALTKMNRIKFGFEKQHYFDALCVGKSTPEKITNNVSYHVIWSYSGRGNRKMVRVDQYGFPLNHLNAEKYNKKGERKGHRVRTKEFKGFQTGDIVIANVTKGRKEGKYRGRVAIRHTGNFNIKNAIDGNTIQGIWHKYCRILQKSDGWYYQKQKVS